jgi:3-oxoacyl-[acyl-carrier protein] reductase
MNLAWEKDIFDFKSKVVLVTGAGRGIGRAIAVAFAAAGASVAANDLTPINLDTTVAQITGAGGLVKDYIFDVAKMMPVQEMVDQVLVDLGRIDFLVNSAGVQPQVPLLEMDEWDWRRTLDVNLCGPFFTTQVVGRAMRQQGGGVIVNIAVSADRANGLVNSSAFVASKTGLIGLTRQSARVLAAYNIRVNAVCPLLIEPDRPVAQVQDEDKSQPQSGEISLGRLGRSKEVADLVLLLCSAAAADITGQVINLDGGMGIC